MPDLLAITIIIAVAVCIAPSLAVRGFSLVGRSLADAPHYQALYDTLVTWLGGHGFSVAGLWAERPRS
jgi:AI-2 transport protein TqsA